MCVWAGKVIVWRGSCKLEKKNVSYYDAELAGWSWEKLFFSDIFNVFYLFISRVQSKIKVKK